MQGFTQVYTGNGKGKTTAALGLALRAAGAGLPVFIAQFIKGMDYSELHSIEKLSGLITLRQYGRDCFIRRNPEARDLKLAQIGLSEVRKALISEKYKVVILDEANVATHLQLFSVEDLLDLIENKPSAVELVITGRYADPLVLEKADLVTEMKEVKHYYTRGVQARIGIEK